MKKKYHLLSWIILYLFIFLIMGLFVLIRSNKNQYNVSSDGSMESFYVYRNIALFHRDPVFINGENNSKFDFLAIAKIGNDPDDPSITRDIIEKLLIEKISGVGWVDINDKKMFLVSGFDVVTSQNLSFDDLVNIEINKKEKFYLINEDKILRADTLKELSFQVNTNSIQFDTVKLISVKEFIIQNR